MPRAQLRRTLPLGIAVMIASHQRRDTLCSRGLVSSLKRRWWPFSARPSKTGMPAALCSVYSRCSRRYTAFVSLRFVASRLRALPAACPTKCVQCGESRYLITVITLRRFRCLRYFLNKSFNYFELEQTNQLARSNGLRLASFILVVVPTSVAIGERYA